MRLLLFAALICGCLFLTGCPYSAMVPLEQPAITADVQLTGKWLDAYSHQFYKVELLNSKEYSIAEADSEGVVEKNYTGYLSQLGKIRFLTVKEEEEGASKYTFYRFEVKPSGIILMPVSDTLKRTFATSFELKAYFEKHAGERSFYEKDTVRLVKAQKK